MRLFLAITVPRDVRLEVVAASAGLRESAPDAVWVAEPMLHLTVKFLGELEEETGGTRLDEIQAATAAVAGRHREFVLTLGGIGAYPNFRRARVVWIGVAQDPRFELLHHDVETTYAALGFALEGRPFRPHLTLARTRERLPEDRMRQLYRAAKQTHFQADFIVRSIELMRSTPSPAGTAYTTLVSAAMRSD